MCAAGHEETKIKRVENFNQNPHPKIYSRARKGWVESGERRFFARSKWEANYGRYLEFLRTCGHVLDWEHEPETFWFMTIKRGCRSYLPDFRVVMSDGSTEYHEVKGYMDPKSKTKIRRMAKYNPSVKLIIRCSKWFKQNNRDLRAIVPGWEQ